jgi:transcriptional regulator with XRE-family HTH domain
MKFGKILREARETAMLNQTQLAERAGLHRTYINQLEHGKKSPSLDVFMQLCHALELLPSKMMQRIERDK